MKFEEAERIQLEAGKRLLAVSSKTASDAVRGDLGWWTMRTRRDYKALSFWGRLCRMKDHRLARAIYLQSKGRASKSMTDWCCRTKKTLCSLGLGHLWVTEQVGAAADWKNLLKSSLQEREQREWLRRLEEKDKLRLYRTLKTTLKKEDYLELDVEARR